MSHFSKGYLGRSRGLQLHYYLRVFLCGNIVTPFVSRKRKLKDNIFEFKIKVMTKEYEEFEVLLQCTDWHWMRADDPRRYNEGLAEMERVIDIRLSLPDQELADKLWNEYSPYHKR